MPSQPRPTARATVVLAIATALVLMALPAAPAAADLYGVEIVNPPSGLRADVMWASTSAYQEVFLWPDNASSSQKFDLLDSGGGHYRIRARHSGQCLMLDWRGGHLRQRHPGHPAPALLCRLRTG